MKIGVLALQGGVIEHIKKLQELDVDAVYVKTAFDLEGLDGIILPGGESTTMSKLLKAHNLENALKEKIQNGLFVYGTCAGLILLAKKIIGYDSHLALMDIVVKRNAYGAQLASFKKEVVIEKVSKNIVPLVFIRAPWIEEVSENVEVLLKLDGRIVFVKQDNMLASSFHPELTNDHTIHKYFIDMIKKAKGIRC